MSKHLPCQPMLILGLHGNIGVSIATSGPGATNLITGLCCSYYDSIPVLAITGQVSTTRMVGQTGVRQVGFQETPIVSICESITKYAVQITNPNDILYELEKSFHIATSGRPGPVLIDIPDNLQRSLVDLSQCPRFNFKSARVSKQYPSLADSYNYILAELRKSTSPIIIAGWGVHLSAFESQLLKFAEHFSIPVALTWGAADHSFIAPIMCWYFWYTWKSSCKLCCSECGLDYFIWLTARY